MIIEYMSYFINIIVSTTWCESKVNQACPVSRFCVMILIVIDHRWHPLPQFPSAFHDLIESSAWAHCGIFLFLQRSPAHECEEEEECNFCLFKETFHSSSVSVCDVGNVFPVSVWCWQCVACCCVTLALCWQCVGIVLAVCCLLLCGVGIVLAVCCLSQCQ